MSAEKVRSYYQKQNTNEGIKIYPPQDDVMQVILIRHGEPDIKQKRWYRRKDVLSHDERYLQSEIKTLSHTPLDISTLPVDRIYHSSLRRAAHTAELLFGENFRLIADRRYREFERGVMRLAGIYLPLKIWKIASRLQWLLGFSAPEIEPVQRARERSRSNARHLEKLALKQKIVVVVAHGFHNRYVGRYMKSFGWIKAYDSGNGFLSMKIFAKDN